MLSWVSTCAVSWSLMPGISEGWSICGKDVQYIVISSWGVNKLTESVSNKQIYEEVARG